MSGGLLTPVTSNDPVCDARTCYLCREEYRDARMLSCCHSFCASCLRDRVMDMALLCPICGSLTKLEEQHHLPAADPVLKFLVETSHEDKPVCANCEQWADAMYFCNTCSQPLCGECRQDTHRARMFSSHQIGPMTLRAREVYKNCHLHGEPFILFSVEKKTMLCITCFHDLNVESRPYCIDLDTAYGQSCHLLDQTVQTVREVEKNIQDGVLLLWSLLQEVKQNAEQERVAILTLYSDIAEKIAAKRDDLLEDVERQSNSKDRQFSENLRQLNCLLPTIQTQLLMTQEFSTTANKYEFLELSYKLMERMSHTLNGNQQLQPNLDGNIQTNYRAQFARSLDSLLSLKPVNRFGEHSPSLSPASAHSHPDYRRGDCVETTLATPTATSTITFTSDGGRKINGSSGVNKVIMIQSDGVFANHFKELENKHRDVVQRFEAVKGCVQELQRDMTLRRCLAKSNKVTELLNSTAKIDDDIIKHLEAAEKQRPQLEKHWENIYRQVVDEQEVYQAQVNDILRMKHEAQHLNTIVKKLAPFIKSITNVTERLSPRLGDMIRESQKGHQMQELFDRINTLEPDSQHRVDAIRNTEEERQQQSANRVNPLDDELIRTKGMLKSPSVRIEREEQARQAREGKQGRDNRKDTEDNKESNKNRQENKDDSDSTNNAYENRQECNIMYNKNSKTEENEIKQANDRTEQTDQRTAQNDKADDKKTENEIKLEQVDAITEQNEKITEKNDKIPNKPRQSDNKQDCDQRSTVEDGDILLEAKCLDHKAVSTGSGMDGCLAYDVSVSRSNADNICEGMCKTNSGNMGTSQCSDSTANETLDDVINKLAINEKSLCESENLGIINDISKGHADTSSQTDLSHNKAGSLQCLKNQRVKELRKCNSLGRGAKEKRERMQEDVTRKFSLDLGGISPDDLALRTLLHDAIIARGDSAKRDSQ